MSLLQEKDFILNYLTKTLFFGNPKYGHLGVILVVFFFYFHNYILCLFLFTLLINRQGYLFQYNIQINDTSVIDK